ncbi:MAG TPA: acetylglutamate kinase [archaeon]|nr:acetylglutamate kinase [archaeon]
MNAKTTMLLKVGGGEVDKPDYLASFAKLVTTIDRRLVIVHGGGKDIGRLLQKLGIETGFHEGLRITDDAAIEVVEMVLSGLVNKRIVGSLVGVGVKALGLSGRDLALVRAVKLNAAVDLGHVGEPERINTPFLYKLLELGLVPVISPVSQGAKGKVYNINADHVASALAIALRAPELVFLSDVPCIYDEVYQFTQLKSEMAEQLIASGVIGGGMIPKVRSGIEALKHCVQKVLITDLEGLEKYIQGQQTTATIITR